MEARHYRRRQTLLHSREARVERPDHPTDRCLRCWFRVGGARDRALHRMVKSSFLVIDSETRMIIGVRPTIKLRAFVVGVAPGPTDGQWGTLKSESASSGN